jgi:hypothetical protein
MIENMVPRSQPRSIRYRPQDLPILSTASNVSAAPAGIIVASIHRTSRGAKEYRRVHPISAKQMLNHWRTCFLILYSNIPLYSKLS